MSTTSLGGGGLTIHPDEKIYLGPVSVDTSQGVTIGGTLIPIALPDITIPPSLPGAGGLPVDPAALSSLAGSAMTTLTGLLNNLSSAPGDVAASLGRAVTDEHYSITPASINYTVGATGAHLVVDNVLHPIVIDFKTP